MNELKEIEPSKELKPLDKLSMNELIASAEGRFLNVLPAESVITFTKEAAFVRQIINNYRLNKRGGNDLRSAISVYRKDFIDAVVGAANIGISLNPALQHAFLIIRKKKPCLEVGYKGLLHLATRWGHIRHAKAEIIKEKDLFVSRGVFSMPRHEFAFEENRSETRTIGAYVVAQMPGGGLMTSWLDRSQIEKRRAMSPGASSTYSPWHNHYDKMCMKSAVRDGSTYWVSGDNSLEARLADVLAPENETESSSDRVAKLINNQNEVIENEEIHS